MGSDGIFVSTPEVSAERAVVKVRSEVTNDADKISSLAVRHQIYSPIRGAVTDAMAEDQVEVWRAPCG